MENDYITKERRMGRSDKALNIMETSVAFVLVVAVVAFFISVTR